MVIILFHPQLALKHDTARVVQCCLKLGSPEQRTSIFTELKGTVDDIAGFTPSWDPTIISYTDPVFVTIFCIQY